MDPVVVVATPLKVNASTQTDKRYMNAKQLQALQNGREGYHQRARDYKAFLLSQKVTNKEQVPVQVQVDPEFKIVFV